MESLTFQKRLLLSYLCHLSVILSVRSYNLDVSSAIVKNGPYGSYFGFSVARHIIFNTSIRAQTPIVLVAAAFVNESEEISRRSAVLFACFISDSQAGEECQRIPIQTSEQNHHSESLLMSVVSQGRAGGVAVACGHKIEEVTQAWVKDWCVSLTNDLKVLHSWDPCEEQKISGVEDEKCLTGINIFVDKRDFILIGAPGFHGGKGVLLRRSLFNVSVLPLLWSPAENVFTDKKSHLGMSVATSYKMLGSGATYMAGAPKSSGVGKVYLLHEDEGRFHVEMELNGCQLGSNFGYKVTSADLNGDGLDELLVGAPTFMDSQSCGGAVYVYNNEDLAKGSTKPSAILTNKFCKLEDSHFSSMTSSPFSTCHHDCRNSWFGLDIELLGDIDQDGFDDIVVGAPYEGDGAIYIFRGSKTGIIINPSQKVSAASLFKSPIRSFGYSLSASHVDFDHNGFPDLVVGCYASDSVVLLRSRPVIDVHVVLTSDLSDNKCKDEDCFVLNICLDYSVRLYKNMKDSSKLELELTLEERNVDDNQKIEVSFMAKVFSRISKDNETSSLRRDLKTKHFKKRVRLTAQRRPDCFQVPVYFTTNNNSFLYDFSLRLTYKMISYTKLTPSLFYSSPTNFVYLHPVLSQDSLEPEERGVLHEVQLVRNCGSDKKCQSNLKVLGLMELPKDIHGTYLFKLNSMSEIKLFIQVGNLMEDAYNSRLFVYSPLPFKGSDKRQSCQPGKGLVTCELENPMRGEDEVSLVLRFDVRQMDVTTESLNIVLLVNSTSDEMDPDNNVDIIDVRIIIEVDLMILGLSIPSEIYYKKQNEESNPRIIHRYEIKNVGHNLATDVIVGVDWPVGIVCEGGMLNLTITNIEVLGNGYCFMINKTIRAIKYKRSSHSINDFFKRYLSLPNRVGQIRKVDCYNSNSWKCLRVECIIENLEVGHSFLMNIHSSVTQSDELIDKLFPETKVFEIKSISRINFINNSKLELQTEDDKHWVTTSVFLANVLKRKHLIPNWMLVISICFGMMTLLVVYSLFYKCGFFKRKRKKVKGSKICRNIKTEGNAIIQVLSCPKPSSDVLEVEDKS